ncbi:Uncharacterised protein [Mycobacteroides abscessus subsp. abscessus]|nr:Uncharacterised protein [Mycobacteroides abscessus subsp. abscessus]
MDIKPVLCLMFVRKNQAQIGSPFKADIHNVFRFLCIDQAVKVRLDRYAVMAVEHREFNKEAAGAKLFHDIADRIKADNFDVLLFEISEEVG